ncbi:glucose-1-phosphate adenylyltransferase subunit GlgD [Anaerotalea alkaliphila]|uniref:Glucose-1-phosphate adenylyltransferase subunit GlgD n=1 Tax=Anaerotalea alkaliphila TaxID=2662126 RepID=A0A7X5HTF5_9FIRM|nr:glucose-1-phosphate adenylyltransferase subunit GlgD [Anaerotalea alkaliphila]NDL66352.1 glucose-1-phosphate adenylyltransferase subunit GlgD [Anaerotalea alkaliphila]
MNNVMGIIVTGGRNERMMELSSKRSVAAIPVGGKYRAIDFVLSNMVNSGINKVGVVTQYSFRSLMDHLGSGKEWDLDRRKDGLFLFPPYLAGDNTGWYKGSADGMYNNISFLRRSNEEYVLISTGNCVYKTQYHDLLAFHKEKDADITMMYRDCYDFADEDMQNLGVVEIGEDGRVLDIQEKPLFPKSKNANMAVYLLKRTFLISLLQESASHAQYDFVTDILIKKLAELKVFAYEYKGYWKPMNSISMFYGCNMELLNPEISSELFLKDGRVFTKVKDETPAKYNEEAEVNNALIADGCIIEGTVINSVLFRGVVVRKGALIKDSIVMQDSVIEEGANLERVILDKEVHVTQGKMLKGEATYPMIVSKNSVI